MIFFHDIYYMHVLFLITSYMYADQKLIKLILQIVVRSYDVVLKHSDVSLSICHLKNNSCLSANIEAVIDKGCPDRCSRSS